jgi:hypothetical protein
VIWSECHCRLPKEVVSKGRVSNLRICKERGRKRKSTNLSLASCSVVVVFVSPSQVCWCTMLPKAYADALNSTPHPIPISITTVPLYPNTLHSLSCESTFITFVLSSYFFVASSPLYAAHTVAPDYACCSSTPYPLFPRRVA